ncbi:integrase [Stutzerimonas stutzeri]|uniref:integrase n=1 Tax=Stutzerimonas stutzeri TaxID=316 RepID=UPI001C467F54|nr:integrase [Stutzerimonas stutzeri]
MKLPRELSFLNAFFVDPKHKLQRADWLKSSFHDKVWLYNFNHKSDKALDWNIELEDGSLLTDWKNNDLLCGLKYILTSSTEKTAGGGAESNSIKTQQVKFARAIHVVDYLLLHSADFELANYGLAGLSANNLKSILTTLTHHPDSSESVYGWRKRVSSYCLNLLQATNKSLINQTLAAIPEMRLITPDQEDENELDVEFDLIPKFRAALYLRGFYRKGTESWHSANSLMLSEEIYKRTLKGKSESKPVIKSLSYYKQAPVFRREHPPFRVTTGERETITPSAANGYKSTIYGMGKLHELGIPAPAVSHLIEIFNFNTDLSSLGRFRTLPSTVVFSAFKDSVELHLKYGKLIVNGFCKLILYCKARKTQIGKLSNNELQYAVGPELVSLGVKQWELSHSAKDSLNRRNKKEEKESYFTKLRAREALLELIGVYIGAVQLVVGAITARRVGELLELHSTTCLDSTEQWLNFYNRKSTYQLYGLRQLEARPIEPIAAQMIKNLIRMQKILVRLGYLEGMNPLFATPATRGEVGEGQSSSYFYNRNLDFLCDYIQTPINSKGERYYIRQHQLRRFFAMLFFHSASFGGLETLQWMLGHTDIEHLWNYITETLDGTILRGAKAQFVAESLHKGETNSYAQLADLLRARYGTDDFALVDTEELEDHILDLIQAGEVYIEPEFFVDNLGKHMRVIVKIKGLS